jgi:hypothetical protein
LRRAIVAFLFLAALAGGEARGARSQALLIGISQYSELENLRYADADARALSQLLTDFAGYAQADVTLVLNQEATKARITAEIEKVIRSSTKEPLDHFILMFAGHGLRDRIEGKDTYSFLAPTDASTAESTFYSKGSEVVFETFIDRAWLARQLTLVNARSIVIVVDSCYSGTQAFGALFLENLGYAVQSFNDPAGRAAVSARRDVSVARMRGVDGGRKVAYLASSRADQQSAEYDELRHGALSYCIFEYIARARREIFEDERRAISVDGMYASITRLFREVKVNGAPLDAIHQPMLLAIPDAATAREMTFFSIQGLRKRGDSGTGTLEVDTSRVPTEISVDGLRTVDAGAPLAMAEGKHHIEVFVPQTAYRTSFTAHIRAARAVTEKLPMHGILEVESFWLVDGTRAPGPPLEVFLNGRPVGTSNLRLTDLLAGTHQLEVRFQGVSKQRPVEIRPDSPLRVNYSVIREASPPPRKDDKGVGNVVF